MKLFSSFLLLISLLVLSGCVNNIRRAEPINIVLPKKESIHVYISAEVEDKYTAAIQFLKYNKPENARLILENIEKNNPGISGVHLNLALIYYASNKFKLARQQVDKALLLSPKNIIAYNLSGTLFRKQGKYKLARSAYATAIKISPDYADAHLNMAILFDIYLQYWEDAKLHYSTYLTLGHADDKQVKLWLQDVNMRLSKG